MYKFVPGNVASCISDKDDNDCIDSTKSESKGKGAWKNSDAWRPRAEVPAGADGSTSVGHAK